MKLGVNIDHIATLREARKIVSYPSPVLGALIAQSTGADSIVAHLREDRRHIKDADLILLKEFLDIDLKLEMSINREIVDIACAIKPDKATVVPERRQEVTTEGGLDLKAKEKRSRKAFRKLKSAGIDISVFIDPVLTQIKKAKDLGASVIELHTGKYSDAKNKRDKKKELNRIIRAAKFGVEQGFFVAAGHGLNYDNVEEISGIDYIEELNIGHSIISRAIFTGLPLAIKQMRNIIK